MKLGVAIDDAQDAEMHLAKELVAMAERHHDEADVYHISLVRAHACAEHVWRLRPFVDVGSGPTSIDNAGIGADEHGCTIQDYVNECAEHAKNHGQYVSCIAKLADSLHNDGIINKGQRQEMKTGAAKSKVGK